MGKIRHFLSITDSTGSEILDIIDMAKKMKRELKENGLNNRK